MTTTYANAPYCAPNPLVLRCAPRDQNSSRPNHQRDHSRSRIPTCISSPAIAQKDRLSPLRARHCAQTPRASAGKAFGVSRMRAITRGAVATTAANSGTALPRKGRVTRSTRSLSRGCSRCGRGAGGSLNHTRCCCCFPATAAVRFSLALHAVVPARVRAAGLEAPASARGSRASRASRDAGASRAGGYAARRCGPPLHTASRAPHGCARRPR